MKFIVYINVYIDKMYIIMKVYCLYNNFHISYINLQKYIISIIFYKIIIG